MSAEQSFEGTCSPLLFEVLIEATELFDSRLTGAWMRKSG